MATSKLITQLRCTWAANELNIPYHDQEWGVPVHDEHKWFEFLILEGAQAGLSWDTVLKKRARYREVFGGFDPAKVARYDKKKVRELLRDGTLSRVDTRDEAREGGIWPIKRELCDKRRDVSLDLVTQLRLLPLHLGNEPG